MRSSRVDRRTDATLSKAFFREFDENSAVEFAIVDFMRTTIKNQSNISVVDVIEVFCNEFLIDLIAVFDDEFLITDLIILKIFDDEL